MASMNRNPNLEEINSDMPLGIDFLQYQTIFQKVLLIGSIILSVFMNLAGTFWFHFSINLTIVVTLIPLTIGVAFGCNYNEDLSLIKYLILMLSKPMVFIRTRPREDGKVVRDSARSVELELRKHRQSQNLIEKEQKRMLKIVVVMVVLFVVFILGTVTIINCTKTEDIHHSIAQEIVVNEGE